MQAAFVGHPRRRFILVDLLGNSKVYRELDLHLHVTPTLKGCLSVRGDLLWTFSTVDQK
jgi:hypothetical protein